MEFDDIERRINEILDREGVSHKNRLYNKFHNTMSYSSHAVISCFSPTMEKFFEDRNIKTIRLEPSKDDVGYMKITDIEFI